MIEDMKKIARSTRIAAKGLKHAYRADKSFRLEVRYGLPVYAILGYLFFPMVAWEMALFALSYALILITELQNTAFEKMLDRVHPDEHEAIGRSKDIASAAVLMAFAFAFLIVAILAWTRLCPDSPYSLEGGYV